MQTPQGGKRKDENQACKALVAAVPPPALSAGVCSSSGSGTCTSQTPEGPKKTKIQKVLWNQSQKKISSIS